MQSYAALNTIALAINQGIEKKDIFVLDKAYKLNGKYKDFSEIDLNTLAINSVYAIGKPVSMEPNQDLVEIKYLFESLHKVNKILYRFAKKRITKEDRLEAYNVLKQKGFLFVLNFIIDKAKNKVEDEERLNVIKNVENECSKVLKKYQEYLADKEHFDDIEAKLEKSNDEELTESEKRVEKNYYKKFYEHIFVLPRPVVGIYYKKENKFSMKSNAQLDYERNINMSNSIYELVEKYVGNNYQNNKAFIPKPLKNDKGFMLFSNDEYYLGKTDKFSKIAQKHFIISIFSSEKSCLISMSLLFF